MTTKSEEKTEDFQKNPLWEHIIYIPYEFVRSNDFWNSNHLYSLSLWSFLAVQTESVDSSIGGIVTHWVSDWVSDWVTHLLIFDIKEWP